MALFAFDGTWNDAKTGEDLHYENTNVVRFYNAYFAQSGTKDVYVPGVGTRCDLLGKILGGVFGLGEMSKLHAAYAQLRDTWAAGDHVIDIVGFSRGAATALDFCHMILDRGIRAPGSDDVVEQKPQIRFLGLWDVVAAFGFANLGLQDLNFGHHLELPPESLKYCFHAMALDERRPSFLQTRLTNAHEVWFRGVHSDVGGGNTNRGLNDVALKWMMSKAKAAGLPITDADIAALKPDATARPHFSGEPPLRIRVISAVDRRHYSVGPMQGCAIPPTTCIEETSALESTAEGVGPEPIEVLPIEVRRRIAYLWEQAVAEATLQGFSLDPVKDNLLTLFQGRISLITNDTELLNAGGVVRTLIAQLVRVAQDKQYNDLHGVFLTEALFKLRPLAPLTD